MNKTGQRHIQSIRKNVDLTLVSGVLAAKDVTISKREKESLNNIRLANNEPEDDASTDVLEISDDEYDGDKNEV